jgi:serine protease Do
MARFWWAALCVTVSAIVIFLFTYASHKKRDALALSTVKIISGGGHGSGTHVGNRWIVTAAHVIGAAETVKVKAQHGGETTADVLWTNKAHDIALIRARDLTNVGVSSFDCEADLLVGDRISAVGNPGPLEFITSYGRVSSGVEHRGPWAQAFVASLVVAGGMSGGPVFNERGSVVGVVVGVALTSIGWSASPIALSYIVPASTVCSLTMRPRNNA